MDLILQRTAFLPDGIFGEIVDPDGDKLFVTLEHAYSVGECYAPKIPSGEYVCKRGKHSLTNMSYPFDTFEVQDVPHHTGILFHSGNFNRDSQGCVLLGLEVIQNNGVFMIADSRKAFSQFMTLQGDEKEFRLKVLD